MSETPRWRPAVAADLDAIVAIEAVVHTLAHERLEIFADKMELFGEGCLMLMAGSRRVGYGIAHPWLLGEVPALDMRLGALPETPACLFIHDVALLPEARGHRAAGAYVERAARVARRHGWPSLALISVYDTYPVWERYGFRVTPLPAWKLTDYGEAARYMTADLSSPAG